MRDIDPDNLATLFYLILLLIVVGGSMLLGSRKRLNNMLQQLGIWGLIFIGFIGAYSMRDQFEEQFFSSRPQMADRGTVMVGRAWDGHFYIDVLVNNVTVKFVVDTGATDIVLTQRDAERVGFDLATLDYSTQASTANGIVPTAIVSLDNIVLQRFKDYNMRAAVNGGLLDVSLLGMEYLNRFTKIEITRNQLLLIRN